MSNDTQKRNGIIEKKSRLFMRSVINAPVIRNLLPKYESVTKEI